MPALQPQDTKEDDVAVRPPCIDPCNCIPACLWATVAVTSKLWAQDAGELEQLKVLEPRWIKGCTSLLSWATEATDPLLAAGCIRHAKHPRGLSGR